MKEGDHKTREWSLLAGNLYIKDNATALQKCTTSGQNIYLHYYDNENVREDYTKDPPSGYLLYKVVSTLLSHFSIIDRKSLLYESKENIPPIMRDPNSPQNWKSWNAISVNEKQEYSSRVIKATIEVAKKILNFPDRSIKDVVHELQKTLPPKMLAVDWTLYLYLLEHDMGPVCESDFSSAENYEKWKFNAIDNVKGLLNGGVIKRDGSDREPVTHRYNIVNMSLIRAVNIHGKAEMTRIYSVIHFQDLYTMKSAVNTMNLNITFNHNLCFLLKDTNSTNDKPVIIVSLWYRKSDFSSLGFLGYVKLSVKDLIENSNGEERTYELQKRSTRSNITGMLTISINCIQMKRCRRDICAEIMTCIPYCQESCLRDLIEVCYLRNIESKNMEDGNNTMEIIETIAFAWNSPYYLIPTISLDLLYNLYAQKKISIFMLRSAALDKCLNLLNDSSSELPVKVKKSLMNTLGRIYQYIQEHLLDVLHSEINENTSMLFAEMIKTLCSMQGVIEDKTADVETVVQGSLYKYFEQLRVIHFHNSNVGLEKVQKYVAKLKEFLTLCVFYLNDTLADVIKMPQLTAEYLIVEVDKVLFNTSYEVTVNIDATFRAYNEVKDLIKTCKIVIPDPEKRVPIRDRFYEGVIAWLDRAEINIKEWVLNALKLDTLQPISAAACHSTSIIDVFSYFSSHLNFIKDLAWPNAEDERLFNERLYATMLSSLNLYISLSEDILKRELSLYGTITQESDSAKLISRKSTASLSSDQLDARPLNKNHNSDLIVTDKICCLINNVKIIIPKLETLLGLTKTIVKLDQNAPIPHRNHDLNIPQSLTLRAQRLIRNAFVPFKIDICDLRSAVVTAPCFMPICVRISHNGAHIATTRPLAQKIVTKYNEAVWLNMSDYIESQSTVLDPPKSKSIISKLDVSIVKIVYENGDIEPYEEVLSTSTFDIDWFIDSKTEVNVFLPDCGDLRIVINPIDQRHRLPIFSIMVNSMVEKSSRKMCGSLALVLGKKYREYIKKISQKFKSISKEYINKILNIVEVFETNSKVITSSINTLMPQSQINNETVTNHLAPILSFLNVNLEKIIKYTNIETSVEIISEVWDKIIFATESLIVPINVESKREKAPYSRDRLKFIDLAIRVLYDFFECGGEGMSANELTTPRYNNLRIIINNYFGCKDPTLKSGSISAGVQSDRLQCEQYVELYWVVQILKVHNNFEGVSEFIEEHFNSFKNNMSKDQPTQSITDTLSFLVSTECASGNNFSNSKDSDLEVKDAFSGVKELDKHQIKCIETKIEAV